MEKIAITGGAGYIGSNFAKLLLERGYKVTIFDKVSLDQAKRIHTIRDKIDYKSIDLTNIELLKEELKNVNLVAHFAASADIALGKTKTDVDLNNGIIATYNVLETMRINKIKKIIFPSSSTIYGNFSKIPTSEDVGMLFPTSLYGASKLAGEAMISSFCHLFGMKSWIFRFGNIIGKDMTRGVIKDFINKLKKNPNKLIILGNGLQEKDFIHIDDCLEAILLTLEKSNEIINVFNLGTGTTTSVNKIAKMIIERMELKNVNLEYTGGESGWPGDAPKVHYDITKIKKIGWNPKLVSDEAVELAITQVLENESKE